MNLNFLTPEYGSRVYLGALLTDAELEPDQPLKDPICPGMTCGRCAATCPTRSNSARGRTRGPRQPTTATALQKACSQGAMTTEHSALQGLAHADLRAQDPDIDRVLDMTYWKDFWIATNSKRGAFAACFEACTSAPTVPKTSKRSFGIPYRMQDVKGGKVEHTRIATLHLVKFVGPRPTANTNTTGRATSRNWVGSVVFVKRFPAKQTLQSAFRSTLRQRSDSATRLSQKAEVVGNRGI